MNAPPSGSGELAAPAPTRLSKPERKRLLDGPLAYEVARFGTPLALGMGLQTTFNLVDAYLIAHLQPELAGPALGAIGICDQLGALGTIISYGLSIATSAIISRKYGEGKDAEVKHVCWQSLLLVTALGVLFGLLGTFGGRFLMVDVMSAKGQVAELGAEYLKVQIGGSITIFLLLHLTTIQRALGSSKTPVSMLITANALNVVLAVLLVFGPGPAPAVAAWGPAIAQALGIPRMELMGAAWATVLARVVVLLPLWVIVVRRFGLFRREARQRPNLAIARQLWTIGWPSSAQLVVRIVGMLMTHRFVAQAYTTATDQTATTALGIVFRLETMALFVGLGWGSAAQTFMGQNLGANRVQRAKQSGWLAAGYNALMMAALAAAYALWDTSIIGFFDDDAGVLRVGTSYIEHVSLSYVGLGIGIALGSAIQGAGATRQTLILDSLIIFGLQLPLSLWVVYGADAGYDALFRIVALTYFAFALVYAASYKRGEFLQTRIH